MPSIDENKISEEEAVSTEISPIERTPVAEMVGLRKRHGANAKGHVEWGKISGMVHVRFRPRYVALKVGKLAAFRC